MRDQTTDLAFVQKFCTASERGKHKSNCLLHSKCLALNRYLTLRQGKMVTWNVLAINDVPRLHEWLSTMGSDEESAVRGHCLKEKKKKHLSQEMSLNGGRQTSGKSSFFAMCLRAYGLVWANKTGHFVTIIAPSTLTLLTWKKHKNTWSESTWRIHKAGLSPHVMSRVVRTLEAVVWELAYEWVVMSISLSVYQNAPRLLIGVCKPS